jgi:predicted RNase H-like HicB family nuclease
MTPRTHTYTVIVDTAPNNFAAYAAELPGVIAVGRTREETLESWKEAVRFHGETAPVAPDPGVSVHRVTVQFDETT